MKPRLEVWTQAKQHYWANATYGHEVTSGQDVSGVFSLQPATIYFVSARALSGTGAYEILVEPLKAYDGFEPNDDILAAKPISIGETVEASTLDAGDADFYQFTSPGSGIHVLLHNKEPGFKPGVSIWASDKSHILSNATYGHEVTAGQDVELEIESESGTSYFVAVASLGGAGQYALTVSAR